MICVCFGPDGNTNDDSVHTFRAMRLCSNDCVRCASYWHTAKCRIIMATLNEVVSKNVENKNIKSATVAVAFVFDIFIFGVVQDNPFN